VQTDSSYVQGGRGLISCPISGGQFTFQFRTMLGVKKGSMTRGVAVIKVEERGVKKKKKVPH